MSRIPRTGGTEGGREGERERGTKCPVYCHVFTVDEFPWHFYFPLIFVAEITKEERWERRSDLCSAFSLKIIGCGCTESGLGWPWNLPMCRESRNSHGSIL